MAVVERGQEGAEEALLRRALRWANRGAGRASPNPLVGAVVVKSGAIVGEGYHKGPGTAHAEVVALGAAGRRARGATLYCNLEPCCHYGKTPPCTDAILNAGVARVVASIVDPSPLVNGRGLEILRQAGLEVSLGGLAEEAAHLNRAYLHWRRSGRPLVTLKLAASLDGKIATSGGESRWITGGVARAYVHRLRRQVDAVVVGSGTALKDDPLLLPEKAHPSAGKPWRVVVDSTARLPAGSRLAQSVTQGKVIVATTKRGPAGRVGRLEAAGVEVWVCRSDRRGQVDLGDLMTRLAKAEVLWVLAEGGGDLSWSLLRDGLASELNLFVAPLVIGGAASPTVADGEGIARLKDALRVSELRCRKVGEDLLLTGSLGPDVHRDR